MESPPIDVASDRSDSRRDSCDDTSSTAEQATTVDMQPLAPINANVAMIPDDASSATAESAGESVEDDDGDGTAASEAVSSMNEMVPATTATTTTTTTAAAAAGNASEEHFLDAPLDVAGLSADQIGALIEEKAAAVSQDDVAKQIAHHDAEIANMKTYMERAVADGVLKDTVDEDAEDGTILLKGKDGAYNPIMDAIMKQAGQAQDGGVESLLQQRQPAAAATRSTAASQQSDAIATDDAAAAQSATAAPTKPPLPDSFDSVVLVETPYSAGTDADPAQVKRYTEAAIEDCIERGEAPTAPQLLFNVYEGRVLTNRALKRRSRKAANNSAAAFLRVATRVVVYSDFGVSKSTKERAEAFSGDVDYRTLAGWSAEDRAAERKAVDDERAAQKEPMPNKTRVNRYTTDDDGHAVEQFPDGVAGYAADGTSIPIINDGKDYNPTIPDTRGDMQFRNRLMATEYRPELDRYTPLDKKQRFLVVSYMGPKNCNMKTDEYYCRVWGVARNPAGCAAIAQHVQRTNPMGKLFNMGVIDMRSPGWFKTAPPQFAKDATATYSNPLHRKHMEAYLREQKRAQVELEQRVMDEDVRSRENVNSLEKQLAEKGMDPSLAQSASEVQAEIASRRQDAQQAKVHAQQVAKQQADEYRGDEKTAASAGRANGPRRVRGKQVASGPSIVTANGDRTGSARVAGMRRRRPPTSRPRRPPARHPSTEAPPS